MVNSEHVHDYEISIDAKHIQVLFQKINSSTLFWYYIIGVPVCRLWSCFILFWLLSSMDFCLCNTCTLTFLSTWSASSGSWSWCRVAWTESLTKLATRFISSSWPSLSVWDIIAALRLCTFVIWSVLTYPLHNITSPINPNDHPTTIHPTTN